MDSRAADPVQIATTLVEARRAGLVLPGYPGEPPVDEDAAYRIQDAAMQLWGPEPLGWKVGTIAASLRSAPDRTRLVGPSWQVVHSGGSAGEPTVAVPTTALIEAEFLVYLETLPLGDQSTWTAADVAAASPMLAIGLEICGSAIPDINELGPWATIADFGNNVAIVVGPRVHLRPHELDDVSVEVFADDVLLGSGTAASLPGGMLEGVAQLGRVLARRGLELRAGQWISTGTLTGAPAVAAGQRVSARFGEIGSVGALLDELS